MKLIPSNVIRQLFILLSISLIGSLIFINLTAYLSGILGAITLFVILKKYMEKLVEKNWTVNISSFTLMFISFITILLPVLGVFFMLGNKLKKASENSEQIIENIKNKLNEIEQYVGIDIASNINTSEVSKSLSENIQNLIGGTFNTLMSIAIMYILLYFMLINYNKINKVIYSYIPFKKKNYELLNQEITSMIKANALGIPLVAIAQGIVALVGFLIFNIDNSFFWAVIVTIGSMIPFIGSMLGIIPVFLIAYSNGETFNAWAVLAYGVILVGATDNLIRLFILKQLDDAHPLITLFGVIIGIPLFGFIGLIFGPLLMNLFFILVRIYKSEYGNDSQTLEVSSD
ncbi:AI-2E family transporter [Wenyingzhuangia marina]|uniref:Predicted PurR-regulated permease PerM n=1 Tax=Wenyingzhuangia marina TaxID=1195760 RepID=A0A1M5U1U7_9FLAO|nr:AI-2E family transporter [Wenyingzhuangia marina]GGF70000.1 AI-2E family transporter [Wenyingzhuangia marina]SHH56948.1 Predicted PurR-regulated permease PerM [Wenyingzhuangia marina]